MSYNLITLLVEYKANTFTTVSEIYIITFFSNYNRHVFVKPVSNNFKIETDYSFLTLSIILPLRTKYYRQYGHLATSDIKK